VLQAALNGRRPRSDHEALPLRADEIALDARRAVAAGADELHVHARDGDGADTLDPEPVGRVVVAVRRACPQVPLGMTTGLWAAGGDPVRRMDLVACWPELPDYVSVNAGEPEFEELCVLLRERSIGIEAGVTTVDEARALLASEVLPHCRRVLVEAPLPAAAEIEGLLEPSGLSQLHHAEGAATWPVLQRAVTRGRDIRVGLEDTLELPDGRRPAGNADLVRVAAHL
jgi:uncharacterized protein (DUF849 family)